MPTPPLRLHNTLSRTKEEFRPFDAAHVRLYVCGPTVYDRAHIGNARPVVVFDLLARLLRRLYPRLTYVRNITDVDDKIMARAAERGVPIAQVTGQTETWFQEDMGELGTAPPDVQPRATEHIAEMIALIERLIARGHAYVAEGHVLFAVPTMAEYGSLSGRSRDEMIAGARVEVAPYKQDPADFVLWKPSADDQPGWPSPWGRGRPGWHIECSAMSERHLGVPFDIHGGGLDLIFPHHENEIAQTRCAHGLPLMAKVWMHNGFLVVNGEKMSKSLGNFFTVRDLLDAGHAGETLRLVLLSTHYRQPLDWRDEGVARAKETLDRCYRALRDAALALEAGVEIKPPADAPPSPPPGAGPAAVLSALLDDLNSPLALAALHEAVTALNKAPSLADKRRLRAELLDCGALLGLLAADPDVWLKGGGGASGGPSEAEVEALVAARVAARKAKNFAEADRLRAQLAELGIQIEDGPKGTSWRRG